MKQVRQLARDRGPGFIILLDHELAVLDSLPLWITALFVALVRSSNWASGQGQTTYRDLVAMLTPIQPRSGRRHYAPDPQAIRRGLIRLSVAGIVRRNTAHSQMIGEGLFFEVDSRRAKPRLAAESAGGMRSPLH